ncbi:ATP-dependent DNA helicase PIF1, partial [Geodia barretti]
MSVESPSTDCIEHERRGAGYWKIPKDGLMVMRASLSKLKLLIIDEVSMVSSLNLAYSHLRLDEIFARDEWFGGVNVLFVGDILQLPPVNGAVFEKINNRSITTKLGCMTSVNIWQENVVYDKLTINKCQKKDQSFSSMLTKYDGDAVLQALNESPPQPHDVEKVKSKFMLMKKVYVYRKQFPLILPFVVTVHKRQGLSLDCAIMDLSEQVFCPGMAYVALSRVKQLENLHLIAFDEDAIK